MIRDSRRDPTRRLKDILWVLTFVGIIAMIFRFAYGLGATTDLSDGVPWGLWKILNMVAGAALATSGFTIGFLGHVLHIKQFQKLVKPAIVVAFLGYGSSLFALLFDIGLPWRFWHPFVYWNIHSFLFEVFWCVSFYFLVTFLELSPTLLERLGLGKLHGYMHRAASVFVIIGITLSSLHHTSLGSLFLVSPQRLHALWYSPLISVMFIVSAMGGGMMLLLVIKVLYSWWYEPDKLFHVTSSGAVVECKACANPDDNGHGKTLEAPDLPMIRTLATVAAGILGFYLLMKVADLILRPEAMATLVAGNWESWLFGVEMVIGVIVPIIMVCIPSVRRSTVALASAGAMAAFGLMLNRVNTGIFGYFRDAGVIYVPTAIEWAITLGVLSMAGLAFFFLVENFSVFNENWRKKGSESLNITSAFDHLTYVWHYRMLTGLERVTLIAVIVLPLSWIFLNPSYHNPVFNEVQPPLAVDVERDTLQLDGNRAGVSTMFAHAAHQERLGGSESCGVCHHLSLPGDQATPCAECHRYMESPADIFDHDAHKAYVADSRGLGGIHPENMSCAECHQEHEAETALSASNCFECHQEDMSPTDAVAIQGHLGMQYAAGYHTAMHGVCIQCHDSDEQKLAYDNPELGECATCHYAVQPADLADDGVLLTQTQE